MEQVQIDWLAKELAGLELAIDATDRKIRDLEVQRDRHWRENMIQGPDGVWNYGPHLLMKDPENAIGRRIGNPVKEFWDKQNQLMEEINELNQLNLRRAAQAQAIREVWIPWHEARQRWARGGFIGPEPEP